MPTPEIAPEQTWPAAFGSPQAVAEWIASALPGQPAVTGPTRIYQATTWAVTAQFALTSTEVGKESNGVSADPCDSTGVHRTPLQVTAHGNPSGLKSTDSATDGGKPITLLPAVEPYTQETVVFKASALDLAGSAPRVYELLQAHCAEYVPRLLASQRRDTQTWMLFATFTGEPVHGTVERLVELSRTLARIQTTLAALPPSAFDGIPRLDARTLPSLLAPMLSYMAENYETYWRRQDGPRAELMPRMPEALARAATYTERIERWANELAAGSWPGTLDHPDLHMGNALVQPNGRMLIYDWEEATVACPFFSMDQLLDDVRALDMARAVTSACGETLAPDSWEARVRGAYLDALPWGTRAARERGLELAMALLPVKKAHEYIQTDLALGRVEGNRHLSAILLDALRRWEGFA